MSEYTIHGGDEGKKRLEILSRTIRPGTELFLKQTGLSAGMRCLDLGCGGGDVTLLIAEMIGPGGHVTGLDLDERKIQLATASAAQKGIQNVDFSPFNVYELNAESTYDLVYSRFLLSHLSDPKTVLRSIRRALRTGGLLLIEDTDFSGHFCYPPSRYFNKYVSLYQHLLKKRGADANIGQKLMGLLHEAGFADVAFQISQPAHTGGEGKRMAEITFDGISKALLEEGLLSAEQAWVIHSGLVKFREQSDSVMSLPRIFQMSGRGL